MLNKMIAFEIKYSFIDDIIENFQRYKVFITAISVMMNHQNRKIACTPWQVKKTNVTSRNGTKKNLNLYICILNLDLANKGTSI